MATSEKEKFDHQFRYIVVGDIAVGKSCIMVQFTQNKFREDHQLTIGAEFSMKNIKINNLNIKLQIWDTAGAEEFQSITRSFYKGSHVAFLVYDITRKDTFDHLMQWLADVKENCNKNVLVVLLGNKTDLENKREVSKEDGEKFAEQNELLFFETSAKNNSNITEAFYQSCEQLLNIISKEENEPIKEGITLTAEKYKENTENNDCSC